MALNYSVLMGRLVRDPELRRTNTGKAVASFTLAVDNFGKDNGASFIDCTAWEKTGEFVNNYFLKGSPIVVEGRLTSRQYETKNGDKRTVVELVVTQAHFCGKKEESNSGYVGFVKADAVDGYSGGEPAYQQANFTALDNEDNLPF
jgi:single-strand DNA-binding protein